MDELGFNKLAAAVLATALGFMGLKEISHAAFHIEKPDTPAYALEIPETGAAVTEEIEAPFPSSEWIAAMDATRGERVFKKCQSCHNADQGGAHGTGPNLWNVVGVSAGAKEDFKYSAAFMNSEQVWTYESLDNFLKKPTAYIKGTNMNFVGLKKENDRAAVIEYMRVRADTPIDRPEAAVLAPTSSIEDIVEDVETAIEDAPSVPVEQ